uniref:Killer toxin Kp4 domain-containing protein n=1 Tax=Panagrolaimus davidi TaxID=227884 RepID=A0A914Q8D3_9BILA
MDGLIDNNRDYNSGENIVCYKSGEDIVASGFCLFLQDTKGSVKGGKIFELLNHLLEHGCKGCGSVPVDFPGSNDPGNGILTMNYVGGTRGCEGLC